MKTSLTDIERGRRKMMEGRVLLCALGLILPVLLLLIRLWQVQALQGPELSQNADRQSLRRLRVSPVRGRIFSREGELLVGNEACYDLVFHLSEMRQPGHLRETKAYVLEAANRYSILFGRPHELVEKRLMDRLLVRATEPVVVFHRLSEQEVALAAEMSPVIPGVEIHTRNERAYKHPGLLSHLLGTTGWHIPVDKKRSEEYKQSFALEELVGTSGLEQVYERELAGESGEVMVQVDFRGFYHGTLYETPARNGYDLRLSIDCRGQQIAERLLQGHKGAFVVVDVESGGVLVMASSPTYDLSTLSKARYAELATDNENTPLVNRAIDGQYTPGSIFKPLIGLAALENGALLANDYYDCPGTFHLGDRKIDCSGRAVHGVVNIIDGIMVSCNGFFINAGLKTGVDNMQTMFRNAGIGEPTEIDFHEHAFGVFPSRDVLYKRKKRNWTKADTALLSIGQGEVLVTPLQVAMYCAALANGGKLLRPYLVSEVVDSQGHAVQQAATVVRHRLNAQESHLAIIREGMVNAVQKPRGSAKVMKECGMAVAAKTGTAEVQGKDGKFKNTWIICYGPLSQPKYALVCLIERGASGGRTAGPLASQFLREWLE